MPSKTTTVRIDEKGRLTIPKPVREALGVEGEVTYAEVTIEVDE